MRRLAFEVHGVVQGVGFRPFVYRIAHELELFGSVRNSVLGVEIEAQGSVEKLALFEKKLMNELPPLASIDTVSKKEIATKNSQKFEILKSEKTSTCSTTLVSPDISTCSDCLKDIQNENSTFFNYFATNCTNCGPRYSIIKALPYDRANSSMSKFEMCSSCEKEYNNPLNRRYHAQPISCNSCGPKLTLYSSDGYEVETKNHIESIASHIKNSKIVAIKSIGGFNLICDATCSEVVSRLRAFKNRPSKPFAIMCRDALHVKSVAKLSNEEQGILCSKEAPIVVLKKLHVEGILSELVAPKIDKIGCLLPYSGLHYILFQYLDAPIVCSSANLSGEPIITTKEDIFKKLPFVDFVLDYDREIVNGVDDSLVQIVNDKMQMLRLGRGYAPKVIKSSSTCKANILAVGASSKNAIALYFSGNIIISPHIGDLESLSAFEFFENTLKSFERFYNFKPDLIVHDMHPSYQTTMWAKKQGVKRLHVEHHLAHIYACRAEFNLNGDYLGFSFDGTGYGSDGQLRGGEIFLGDKRLLHFKPIKLLGSHKAIKEPRRVALSMLFEYLSLDEVLELNLEVVKAFTCSEIKILHQSYLRDLNAPKSSSVGRLFDAIASFSNLLQRSSYEGESGLLCESVYDSTCKDSFEYEIVNGVIELKIVESILVNDFSSFAIVSMFINTLVDIIVEVSRSKKMDVILSGGVFQNKTLLELTCKALKKYEISYYYQQSTSINDGSIALGQINYALFTQN